MRQDNHVCNNRRHGLWLLEGEARKVHPNNVRSITLSQFLCLSSQDSNLNGALTRQLEGMHGCALKVSQNSSLH